jgi:hypothetical protein
MTAIDRRRLLREAYGLTFPESLFGLWDLACRLQPEQPRYAYQQFDMSLDGVFDVLAGDFDKEPAAGRLWTHDMSYNDPPEFHLIAWGEGDGEHLGLWYDDPAAPPACIVSYYNSDAYDLGHYPADLFLTLRRRLEERWESDIWDDVGEDFAREFDSMRQALRPHMPTGTKRRRETGADYLDTYIHGDVDDSGLVAVTWGQERIVAPAPTYRVPPADDETIWREVREPDGAARWLNEAERALRDGFPATALKLGKDVRHLAPKSAEPAACRVMAAAYVALGRPLLAEILEARTAQRDAWDAGRAGS